MHYNIDTRLKLLAGFPLKVESYGEIKPKTLKDIIEVGYMDYMKMLNIISLSREDINEDLPKEITDFEVLLILGNDEIRQALKQALEFFLDDTAHLFPEKGLIVMGTEESELRLISKNNYEEIREMVHLQNYVISVDGEDVRLKDEKAREIAERLKKAKNEVQRIKKKDSQGEDESDFFDLVSAISCKSNSLNIKEILNLTVFQLYEEYKRLNLIDQYETNISALLQGAKNVKLKHWSSKIKY